MRDATLVVAVSLLVHTPVLAVSGALRLRLPMEAIALSAAWSLTQIESGVTVSLQWCVSLQVTL